MQHKMNVPIAISPMWNLIYKHVETTIMLYTVTIFYEVRLCWKENESRPPMSNIMRIVVNLLQYTSILVVFFVVYILWKNIMKYSPTYELEGNKKEPMLFTKESLKRDFFWRWQYQNHQKGPLNPVWSISAKNGTEKKRSNEVIIYFHYDN